VQNILDAIQSGNATSEDFASLELPESYRAAFVKKEEVDMFEGLTAKEKDPRKSLHVEEVPLPELGPGEAFVAVMASAINYNTVWTSIFEPVSTFGFLERYGRNSELTKRHDLPYHVVGSDLAGVVLKTGPASPSGSPATASSRTACPSSWRAPTDTTTRCSTPSSGSGASRPTSAASRTSRWSRPTS